jgi:hypothetical protein
VDIDISTVGLGVKVDITVVGSTGVSVDAGVAAGTHEKRVIEMMIVRSIFVFIAWLH